MPTTCHVLSSASGRQPNKQFLFFGADILAEENNKYVKHIVISDGGEYREVKHKQRKGIQVLDAMGRLRL